MQMKCERCGKDLCFDESNACAYCGYPAPEDIVKVTAYVNERLDKDFPNAFEEDDQNEDKNGN